MAERMVSWKQATNETNSWQRIPSSYVNAQVLAANVAETVTWPDGACICLLSANADYYTNTRGTAAVPVTDVTDGSASELNTVVITKRGGQTAFSIVSGVACIVTESFYAE